MNVKEKIYAIKDKKGMTLSGLAEKADISRDTIMKWDINSPSIKNLQKVADALEVPLTELLGD